MRFIATVILLLGVTPLYADPLADMDAIVDRAPTLETFLSDPDLLNEYKKAVQDYYGVNRFHCQTFQQVISDLKVIVAKIPWVKDQIWKRYEEKTSLLVMAEKGNVYGFRSVSRKLHAIWSYETSEKCDDTVCENIFKVDKKGATVLLGRWSVVLSGAQVHLVEKNGHYTGMAILLSPYQRDEKTYGMVEAFGSPEMQNLRVPFRRSLSEQPKELSLLEVWTEKFMNVKPFWVAGLLMPKHFQKLASNSGSTNPEQSMRFMDLKKKEDKSFLPLDPASQLLAAHLAGNCSASSLPLNTVMPMPSVDFDNLVLVTPTATGASVPDKKDQESTNLIGTFAAETGSQLARVGSGGQNPALLNGGSGIVGSSGLGPLTVSLSNGPSLSQSPMAEPSGKASDSIFKDIAKLADKKGSSSSAPPAGSLNGSGSIPSSFAPAGAMGGMSGLRSPASVGSPSGGSSNPRNGEGNGPGSLPPAKENQVGQGPGPGPGPGKPPGEPSNPQNSELERLRQNLRRVMSKSNPSEEEMKKAMVSYFKAAAHAHPKEKERAKDLLSRAYMKSTPAGVSLFETPVTSPEERGFLNSLVKPVYEAALDECPLDKK